jgi:Ca2+-binding RTX toxin-like protein
MGIGGKQHMRVLRWAVAGLVGLGLGAGGTVVTGGSAVAKAPTCLGEPATIVGTDHSDHLVGTPRRDVIVAGEGGDRIQAQGGDDLMCAGRGDDVLLGGNGDDRLYGQRDRYVRSGEDYWFVPDRLVGGPGADVISGGDDGFGGVIGHDQVSYVGAVSGVVVDLEAGTGPTGDRLVGIERVIGSRYDDHLTGTSNTWDGDQLVGLEGDDWLESPVAGQLHAGPGADVVVGGTSIDKLFGGPGADEVDGNGESDRIYGGESSDSLSGGDGHDIMFAGGLNTSDTSDNVLDGGAGNDLLEGSGGSDRLSGGDGDDSLFGAIFWSTDGTAHFGRDTLNGDAGDDDVLLIGSSFTTEGHATVDGGEGQDVVRVYEVEVPPEEQSPATIDLAGATASIEGGAEQVALPGFESARGTPVDDVLIGTDGPNELDGDRGDDTIVAAGGDDTITASDGHDQVDAGAGDDEVHMPYQSGLVDIDAGAGTDLVDIGPGHPVVVDLAAGTWERDGVQAPFVDVENVIGTVLSDVLRGSDGPNLLEADGGDDVVVGRGGDDQLTGSFGDDKLGGGLGNDSADGGPGVDTCTAETVTNCEG